MITWAIFKFLTYSFFFPSSLLFFLQSADIQPTLRVLIDAVTRTFPMARYTPVTPKEKVQIFMAEHLAPSLYEILYGASRK